MALEVGSLDGDDAIIGGMALVEAIAGELFPIFKDGAGGFLFNAALDRPAHKLLLVLVQLVLDLLGDGLAQVVRFGGGIASQLHSGEHELFLVHREAVGLLEERLEQRVAVLDGFLAVHTADIGGDKLHGTRAEERYHGDDVFDGGGLHLHQVAAHTRAFHLEHTGSLAATKQGKGSRVIGGDVVQGQFNTVAAADEVTGAGHDGEGGQTEEIHLEQAEQFNHTHLELSDDLDGRIFGSGGSGGAVMAWSSGWLR